MALRQEAGGPLDDYDQTFLECRDLRHSWTVEGYYRRNGEVERRLACTRCPTTRTDRWSPRGDRIGSRYQWPEGYRVPAEVGVSFYDVRVETLKRVQVFDDEEAMVAGLFSRPRRAKGRTR